MAEATQPDVVIEAVSWTTQGAALRQVRSAVFIDELGAAEEAEFGHRDAIAQHLLASHLDKNGTPIPVGCVRWQPSGQLERLAVRPEWRGRRLGAALLAGAVRALQAASRISPWLVANEQQQRYFLRLGFAPEPADGQDSDRRLVLQDSHALLPADLASRRLGRTPGRLFLDPDANLALAIATLARQAHRRIDLLSWDLNPALYEQAAFLEAVRYLALELSGRLPVRILLVDASPAIKRGHQLIELARRLSTDIQIRAVPADWVKQCDQFLLCDDQGYALTPLRNPRRTQVDFRAGAETRRLRRLFEHLWEQSEIHQELRRLYL
jgi:GNAT superfamily N-acetyltransferase